MNILKSIELFLKTLCKDLQDGYDRCKNEEFVVVKKYKNF